MNIRHNENLIKTGLTNNNLIKGCLHLHGFTIVELLVVIGIIGLLGSLLLPSLAQAKNAAKFTACKNNLKQLGIALNVYVTDYDKYPGNGAMYGGTGLPGQGSNFQGIWATGMNWLNPYLGEEYDPNHLKYRPPQTRSKVARCPSEKGQSISAAPGPIKGPIQSIATVSYGYNELGSGWMHESPLLGLGFVVQTKLGENASLIPSEQRVYVRPSDVVSPSNLIAIGEGSSWLAPNKTGGASFRYPHKLRGNVVFPDGHVEHGKESIWLEKSDRGRSRWNNDNLPHPETW